MKVTSAQTLYEGCLVSIQTGQLGQALELLQPCLATGKDSEALRLLALIEIRQNQPAQAVATLKQALGIERNALILANLANALVYAGDLQAAETVSREALTLEEIPEVWNTLGSLLAMRKAYREAVQAFERALALRPDYTQALCNLANARFLSGDIERAFEDCLRLLALHTSPRQSFEDSLTEIARQTDLIHKLGDEVLNTLKELAFLVLPVRIWSSWTTQLLAQPCAASLQYEGAIRSAINHWLREERMSFNRALAQAAQLREQGIRSSKGLKSLAAYEHYLRVLSQIPATKRSAEIDHAWVLGDSHVLSWQGQEIRIRNHTYRMNAELVMGAKAFHIAAKQSNRFLWRLRRMLAEAPTNAPLIFSFGEIDCRLDEGILPFMQKSDQTRIEFVPQQAHAYAKAIRQLVPIECPEAWVIGVPAPNLPSLRKSFPDKGFADFNQLVDVIRLWNLTLAKACQHEGLGFVDVYALTVGEDGGSNLRWHCDDVHLQPGALGAATWIPPKETEAAASLNAQGAQLAGSKRYAEAEQLFLQALVIDPGYVDARINLSAVHFLMCKPEQAWISTLSVLGYPPLPFVADSIRALGAQILQEGFAGQAGQFNTLKEIAYASLPVKAWEEWNQLLSRPKNRAELRHEGAVRQAISAWLTYQPENLSPALDAAREIREAGLPENKSARNLVAYENYLTQLLSRSSYNHLKGKRDKGTKMYALGDSHVLSWHGQTLRKHQQTYMISAELVMGGKAFHIGYPDPNHFQFRLRRMLDEVPPGSALLFSFGEIDCRVYEGLLPYLQATGGPLELVVTEQVSRYIDALAALIAGRWQPVWITGVPAPRHDVLRARYQDRDEATWQLHVAMIRAWNKQLAQSCHDAGFGFIDIYALTAEDDETANGQWHCDTVHLVPNALSAAQWTAPVPADRKKIAIAFETANQAMANLRLQHAERHYRFVMTLEPNIPQAHNNLGTVLKEQGRLKEARICFERAVALRSDYASAHSNLLFAQQYAPAQTLADLRAAHEDWARQHLKGITPADPASFPRKEAGPIVVGLVSPDLYAHPVGVFLLPWLENHDRGAFRLIAYADSQRDDPIARRIRSAVDDWRVIAGQDDEAVAQQIAADQVDILIDLAGHTAGNRLKLFARRAAPIQVSWLGYSATTGVPAMDAVLMDPYTAPPGVEEHFTEQLVRLDGLRFCYTPPSYAPAVSPSPALRNGHITFGSFNNLAKITPEVIETWADILKAVPTAQLVLKWKSLGDSETRDRVITTFAQHGVDGTRIECRGWSSHPQMLAEYADIDIALDPFPFSGGLTSCDAMFMGVPVLTLPGELPISRQTGSFLGVLGLQDWIAKSQDNYIDKAVALAKRIDSLRALRQTLRPSMANSRLCDGVAYAGAIESALINLRAANSQVAHSKNKDTNVKSFLHIGCGPKRKDQTTRGFNTEAWKELRFDIDESVKPDLVGTMTDMSSVGDASVDAIFSSHNIEHLYPHEVPLALKEFLRVLKPEGFLVVTCPDLQSVCALIAEDKLTEAAYTSPAGPIAPIDILYGHRPAMARGNLYMAHRCGFTSSVLSGTLQAAGFKMIAVRKRPSAFDLWAVASKSERSEEELRALAAVHFPAQPQ